MSQNTLQAKVSTLSRHALFDAVWTQLNDYRSHPKLIWDARDNGNFHGTSFDKHREVLRRSDPDGLCEALLLYAMSEGIINTSKVTLADVLRTADLLPQLQAILHTQRQLNEVMGDPMQQFHQRVTAVLLEIKATATAPSWHNLAICLRDALYSLDSGLMWSWIEHQADAPPSALRLGKTVFSFPTMQAFIATLRDNFPYGAHVVHVGHFVMLALKQPGRTAYISAMQISEHTGNYEAVGANYQPKQFDFDMPAHRFPEWSSFKRDTQTPAPTGMPSSVWGTLADLPETTVMWLVMLVETLADRFDDIHADATQCIEVARLALPGAITSTTLPTPYVPRFQLAPLSIADGIAVLGFTEWEKSFLVPLTEGLDASFFLPYGTGKIDLPVPDSVMSGSFRSIPAQTFNPDVAGTEERLNTVRRTVFLSNLARYLMTCGRYKLEAEWEALKPMFVKRVKQQLDNVFALPFASVITAADRQMASAVLYTQHPKRVQFNPLCAFDNKSPASHYILLLPQNSDDIAAMLRLKTSQLPPSLQGWTRNTDTWTSRARVRPPCTENVTINSRPWSFATDPVFSVAIATTELYTGPLKGRKPLALEYE